MSDNTNWETPAESNDPVSSDPTPTEPAVAHLNLDEQAPESTPAPDLGAVDAPIPATPVAGPSDLNLGDPAQVAQATYGETQQAYQQPTVSDPTEPQPSYAPQQGYAPPPQQGYQPPPPAPYYPQQGYAPGMMNPNEETTWAMAAHWSALVGTVIGLGFLGPLLVMLIKGPESPRVRAAAVESLNFEITYIIAMIVSLVATIVLVGFVTLFLLPLAWLVLRIVATVAASKGEDYRYPATIRLVK